MHHSLIAWASASVAAWVMPTHTGTEALAFILRWIHLLAGITWVGLLYFFNLVNVPFMKQVDAGIKPKIFQYLTMPALQLFRWSAMLTVFVGFWYWSQIYVAAAAHRMGVGRRKHDRPVSADLGGDVDDPVFCDLEDAKRVCIRRHHGGAGLRRRLAVRELHPGRTGRQPRAFRRHWRRDRLHHAV